MDAKELGLTINHLLRYAFGGLLFFVLSAVVEPARTKEVVEALGSVLSPLVALAIGSAIYMFYRPIVGQMLIWNLYEWVHSKRQPKGAKYTCRLYYLQKAFNVSKRDRWTAYRLLRDKLLDKEHVEQLNRQHSEIHLLYVSFTILMGFTVYLAVKQCGTSWEELTLTIVLGASALLCLLSGMAEDTTLCQLECAHLMLLDASKVTKLLADAGIVPSQESLAG